MRILTAPSADMSSAADANNAIGNAGLCPWTSGNASVRKGGDIFIKGSGAICATCIPSNIVRVDLSGGWSGKVKPSTDTATHLYIYNHLPEINAVVHTHSTFATAFAVARKSIPCIATMIADEFGGPIPVSEPCAIGDDEIGKDVVRLYEATKCPAVLIAQHGVFAVGKTVEEAVKAAVMVEECAKVVWHAMQMGETLPCISAAEIAANHKRYSESYGQR